MMQDPVLAFVHVYEPAASPEQPMLLLLHGTGGDEKELLPLGRALLPGAGRLSPRGPVLEQGMPRFFRRLAPGVFDLADLKARTDDLAAFVTAAAGHYGFDRRRIIAAGFSNGANIAASLLLRRPGVLSGAVLFSPMVPLVPDEPPALAGVNVFINAGRSDPLVTPDNVRELAAMLTGYGASVTTRWTPAGHTISPDDVAAAAAWLAPRAVTRPV